jgi:acyl-CoA synthetase (AMP-forming)/AMP-acid ligase II
MADSPNPLSPVGLLRFSGRWSVWAAEGLVVAGGVESEVAEEFTGVGVDDADVQVGDVGSIDEDDYLHVIDRIKEIIIVGVSSIYPADLEAILHESPDIAAAAVVGVPDGEYGEVPVAFVVPGRGGRSPPSKSSACSRDV